MAYRAGFETTNLEEKCGSCRHYTPLTKFSDKMGFDVEYCRGHCGVSKGCDYRSRTDGCKKWEGEIIWIKIAYVMAVTITLMINAVVRKCV